MVTAVDAGGGGVAQAIEDEDVVTVIPPPPEPEDVGGETGAVTAYPAAPYYVQSMIAAQGEPAPPDPVPPGTTTIALDATPAEIGDDWYRAGKASIGMGDPELYDRYMSDHAHTLGAFASAFEPEALGLDALRNPIVGGYTATEVRTLVPVAAALAEETAETDVAIELVASERLLGDLPVTPFAIQVRGDPADVAAALDTDAATIEAASTDGTATLAVNWTAIGTDEGYARAMTAIQSDPALLAAWAAATDPGRAPADVLAEYLQASPSVDPLFGILAASPETQAQFFAAYGVDLQTGANPAGLLVDVGPLADDEVIVHVDATPLAGGPGAALTGTVNADAVDGLAQSTLLPAPPGVSQDRWRAGLDALTEAPPPDIEALKLALIRDTDLTQAEIAAIAAADPGWLPSVFNAVRDAPPIAAFNDVLALEIVGGAHPNYAGDLAYDPNGHAVVIDTSIVQLGGDQERFADHYAVSDVPLTIRVPLWEGAPTNWENPTDAQIAQLNAHIESIGTVDLFLHGYQSDRGVWEPVMQDWMNATGEPAIGIAIAGMGSEGNYAGSGDSQQTFLTNTGPVTSPYSPKQYGFSALEVMNELGLFGREINVVGHSMGGAAAMQLGMAIDRLEADAHVAGGASMRYVLLEPAPSGDSVPFLREGPFATMINLQNWAGTGILEGAAHELNKGLGPWVIDNLMDQAPQWIKNIHAGFATEAGFNQLRTTAHGLLRQQEPDPAAVAAWLEANTVYVMGGDNDEIVSTAAVQGIFGADRVGVFAGDHYAHVESWAALEPEIRALFGRPAR